MPRFTHLVALSSALFLLVGCPAGDDDDDSGAGDDDAADDDTADDDDMADDDDVADDDDDVAADDDDSSDDPDGDGWTVQDGDCDEGDATVYPGAPEVCDGKDNDCDGIVPADEEDGDGDGHPMCSDCDDTDDMIHPDGHEGCRGADGNCDGAIDVALTVPGTHPTILDAINAAADGDTICVAAGLYDELLSFGGKAILVQGEDAATTILDDRVLFATGEGPGSVLADFTIQNGRGQGGGIQAVDASPTLTDLIVTHNEGYHPNESVGGGIDLERSSSLLRRIVLTDNTSVGAVGIQITGPGSPQLLDVVVARNGEFASSGPALAVYDAEPTLENVLVAGNEGMGVYLETSDVTLRNVALVGNAGHGLSISSSTVRVTAAVVAGNEGYYGASGVYATGSDVHLTGVLVSHNVSIPDVGIPGGGIHVDPADPGSVSLSHCDVVGNEPEDFLFIASVVGSNGNVSVEPDLIDTGGADALHWDLHLSASSQLIDASDPAIDDPDGSRSDVGAYSGPGASSWDLDGDRYPEWWLPGPYDAGSSPGLDCDDGDPAVYPGSGC